MNHKNYKQDYSLLIPSLKLKSKAISFSQHISSCNLFLKEKQLLHLHWKAKCNIWKCSSCLFESLEIYWNYWENSINFLVGNSDGKKRISCPSTRFFPCVFAAGKIYPYFWFKRKTGLKKQAIPLRRISRTHNGLYECAASCPVISIMSCQQWYHL